MYLVKNEIKIIPDGYDSVNKFFHDYVMNNYFELGARLVGRWVDLDHTVITEIWEFEDIEHYQKFFSLRKGTTHYKKSQMEKLANDKWIISKKEIPLIPTGDYELPCHHVAASGYITNEHREVLLVRSLHRSDTLELPGGMLESDESLMDCVLREVKEETGLDVSVVGLVNVSQNLFNGVLVYVFHAKVTGGAMELKTNETTDVGYYPLQQLDQLVTRRHFKERIIHSSQLKYIPLQICEKNCM